MKKLSIFIMLVLSGNSLASTIEQSLDKDEYYRTATIATVLFMCSKQYPDKGRLLKGAALTTLAASGDIEKSKKIGSELLEDSEFVFDVQDTINSDDGQFFCLDVATNIVNLSTL
ncbi:TPA: hypothetical protein ACX6SR_000742 [Photobacterium damselae]